MSCVGLLCLESGGRQASLACHLTWGNLAAFGYGRPIPL
jgi:hypothetical protein